MTVAIIDCGSGNLRSCVKAFEKAAARFDMPPRIRLTNDPAVVWEAERIVLPGQGAFGQVRQGVAEIPGMLEVLHEAVYRNARTYFGICVGMQFIADKGREHGHHEGLGWIHGDVVPIEPKDPSYKIPHMGWNDVQIVQDHPLFTGLPTGVHFYFVHSYHFRAVEEHVLAVVDHNARVTAAVGCDNVVGVQFHPDKSQAAGVHLIENFMAWRP
ncbi:MAG: imidazole glycerol phosphate synthase subunit HisH [Pseudomonadota bacterium]